MKKLLILLAALLIAGGALVYFYQSNPDDTNNPAQSSDPFADIKPQSFGTQGKVTSVDDSKILFEGAVSSVKDGTTFITYEKKTAILTAATTFYKYDKSRVKVQAQKNDVKNGSEITVLTHSNPNQTKEFVALEVLIIQ